MTTVLFVLTLVAVVLAGVVVAQAPRTSLLGWAVLLLGAVLLVDRWPF